MKNLPYILLMYAGVLAFPYALELYFGFGESYLYPSVESHLPLLLPIIAIFTLRNFFTRFFLSVWVAWLLVGETFILSYYEHNPYYIAQAEGCLIYALFLAALSAGMLLYEQSNPQRIHGAIHKAMHTSVSYDLGYLEYGFVAYPFIWIAIIYSNIGFIPLLAGKDITDSMYEIQYGYIYGYGLYNCVSALVVYRKLRMSRALMAKVLWGLILLVVVLIMSFDSKRLFLLLTILAIMVYEQMTTRSFRINKGMIVAGLFALVMYSGLQSVRLGNSDVGKYSSQGLPVGVEFREYIRTVNSFGPGDIANYDLLTSTLGQMLNSSLIRLAGFDKTELISQDSATAWMKLFDDNNALGIRTGLISEVYFAYDFAGLLLMVLIGYGISALGNALLRAGRFSHLVMLATVYGLTLLTVFGQLSVWGGCLTVLAYLYALLSVFNLILGRKSPQPAVPYLVRHDLRRYSRS
ncbi:hypothetical protein F5984_01440 [Rudanella paleaurantiibacter]|uniref:Oligosaccharide repeat unit polymerase n=1 Tax=Rudanella paleaurantiibacter TaxID=2614655 RepID=A0A7J5U4F4_9BACT|nr:hypothetical protein [Rudanella paleaurantiibacter]KAB7732646.1 hypothetical protein F5984_01440 [Rudanella paleaurantiibacter]